LIGSMPEFQRAYQDTITWSSGVQCIDQSGMITAVKRINDTRWRLEAPHQWVILAALRDGRAAAP
jgi:hypothetical protein